MFPENPELRRLLVIWDLLSVVHIVDDSKDVMMAAEPPNETLGQLLACLSWSGERLARELCRVLGTGAVHPTTPYKWLKGHQPRRDEIRQATAFVLSQASTRPITVNELGGCRRSIHRSAWRAWAVSRTSYGAERSTHIFANFPPNWTTG